MAEAGASCASGGESFAFPTDTATNLTSTATNLTGTATHTTQPAGSAASTPRNASAPRNNDAPRPHGSIARTPFGTDHSERVRRHRLTPANDVHALPLPPGLVNATERRGLAGLEPAFRKAVPALIIVFLVIAAVVRGASLWDMRLTTQGLAEREITMVDDLLAAASIGDLERALETGRRELVDDAVRGAMRESMAERGTVIALADASGTVISDGGYGDAVIGQVVEDVVGADDAMLRLGAQAGVRSIRIAGDPALGVMRRIGNGTVLTYRPEAAIFAEWRQRVTLNVAMFASTAAVLIMLLYGYFTQATNARDADDDFFEGMRRMDAALARGRCGLWEWDVTRGRVEWSRSMYAMLGLTPRDLVLSFAAMRDRMHPDDDVLPAIAERIAAQETDTLDSLFRMRHADGTWIWLHARCELERRGSSLKLIGIAMDVTKQKELEELQRETEARQHETEKRLNDAIANISESFVLWDADGRLVKSNDKFAEWHGLSRERACEGAHRDDLVAPLYTRAREKAGTAASVDGVTSFNVKVPTGRWLQVSERRLSDGSLAAVGTDITDIKNHAERLRQSERKLNASVQDLTNARLAAEERKQEVERISDEYLAQKREAEAANRSKSEFMANMSHELRTPLNAIIGFSDMMTMEAFGPLGEDDLGRAKYGEYTTDIGSSAKHLLSVINDILDMSKIEAQRFELDRSPLDVCPLIEETVRSVAIGAEEKNIAVSTDIAECLTIEADERALKQVMLNVLSNAVKFTPAGGQVSVSAKRRGKRMEVVIQDTGIGIPKKALRRIAQPFEQVQNQYTKSYEGSGLGLAISRALAEMHGGKLSIRSVEGEGTCVTLRIPLADPNDGGAQDEAATADEAAVPGEMAVLGESAKRSARVRNNRTPQATNEGEGRADASRMSGASTRGSDTLHALAPHEHTQGGRTQSIDGHDADTQAADLQGTGTQTPARRRSAVAGRDAKRTRTKLRQKIG